MFIKQQINKIKLGLKEIHHITNQARKQAIHTHTHTHTHTSYFIESKMPSIIRYTIILWQLNYDKIPRDRSALHMNQTCPSIMALKIILSILRVWQISPVLNCIAWHIKGKSFACISVTKYNNSLLYLYPIIIFRSHKAACCYFIRNTDHSSNNEYLLRWYQYLLPSYSVLVHFCTNNNFSVSSHSANLEDI